MQIIDCDVHPYLKDGLKSLAPYLPQPWRDRLINQNLGYTARPSYRYTHPGSGAARSDAKPPSGGVPGSDPQFMIEDLLNRYPITQAILMPIQLVNAWNDADLANVYMTALNDYFVAEWLPLDERFRLALCIFPQDPHAAAREIRRFHAERKVVAIFMPLLDVLMGSSHYDPIYEACQELQLPVITHPSGAEGTYHGAPRLPGVPATYVERHVSLSLIGQSNLSSLILEGTFERFPGLKVVFAEWGFTWAAPLMWRLDAEWQASQSELPLLSKKPSDYFAANVRFTTQPLEEPHPASDLVAMMRMMRAEKTLLFSTDYPHWDADNPISLRTKLPADLQDRIFSANAAETFSRL